MSQFPNAFQEKLLAMVKRLKELLGKDYSLNDLKSALRNLGPQAKSLQARLVEISKASSRAHAEGGIESDAPWDFKRVLSLSQNWVLRQRKLLLTLLAILAVLLLHRYALLPYVRNIEAQLSMRPAQWSQLQSLIKLSKSNTSTVPAMISTVAPLDEMELQKLKGILTSRGIKPSVLRLTTDNPPRVELQSNEVMFSVLLDALDELRTTWRLYPSQLNVVASSGPGVVNISATLLQFGGNTLSSSSANANYQNTANVISGAGQ